MLTSPSTARRTAGKALIALTAAAALPLTASRATQYVDVPETPPARAAAPAVQPAAAPSDRNAAAMVVPAVATTPAAAPAASGDLPMPDLHGVTLGKDDVAFMDDDTIIIGGKRKTLEQLTPAQRAKLREELDRSKRDLARERTELPARLAEAREEIERARSGKMKADFERDLQDVRRDLAELDLNAAELRAAGENPAKRKAEIEQALREMQSIDIDKQVAEAMRDADPAKITAELRSAEQQMDRLSAKLDRLDRQ